MMKLSRPSAILLTSCLTLFASHALTQTASVGRGASDPLIPDTIVGADGRGLLVGPFIPPEGLIPVIAASNGDVPAGINALAIDIFNTKDFYKDLELWSDPRYFRCNSSLALEAQWGATETSINGDNPPVTAAWGYCDRDYPRDQIVSPYSFTMAKAHYEALLEETTAKGGPTVYTQSTLPDWNGNYIRQSDKRNSWYDGSIAQISTYLSLLTPKYQQYYVQQMFHYASSNAAQWPGSYCWPEGFMRRFSHYSGVTSQLMMTPYMIQDLRWGAQNMMTHINIGREFNQEGAVPRLGPDVSRWYGETVGFWDEEALITWTSNVQGWTAHASFEFTNQLQTVEIYTPRKDEDGALIGYKHETIIYDADVLVDPVRIVHFWTKGLNLNEGAPYAHIECIQQNFPVNGIATPFLPGQTLEYTVPNIYDRPWADNWETYHEEGMEKPQEQGLFGF